MYKEVWHLIVFVGLGFSLCLGGETVDVEYKVFTDHQNWFQAYLNCKSQHMELASIMSEHEQNQLHTYLKEHGHEKLYWIGGTRLGNGKWYWISNGAPLEYTFWRARQPDNTGSTENCINVALKGHGWNDLSCNKTLGYICQSSKQKADDSCENTFYITLSGSAVVNVRCRYCNCIRSGNSIGQAS